MNETILTINKKTFKLIFSLKVLRLLGEKIDAPSVNTVTAKILEAMNITDDLRFEQLSVLFHLIISSIEANPENETSITFDELETTFLKSTVEILAVISEVVKGFINTLPAEEVGKLIAQIQSNNPVMQSIQAGMNLSEQPAAKLD